MRRHLKNAGIRRIVRTRSRDWTAARSIVAFDIAQQWLVFPAAVKNAVDCRNAIRGIDRKRNRRDFCVTFDPRVRADIVALVSAFGKCRKRQTIIDDSADEFFRPRPAAVIGNAGVEIVEPAFRPWREDGLLLLHRRQALAARAR